MSKEKLGDIFINSNFFIRTDNEDKDNQDNNNNKDIDTKDNNKEGNYNEDNCKKT